MPLYESACVSECAEAGKVIEWYARNSDQPDPPCEECGNPLQRQVSRFGIVWTGLITNRYLDRSLEGAHGDGGHWAYRTKDTKSGKPEPVYIESFQQQREFCKEQGLGLPQDTSHGTISPDGRSFNPISRSEAKDMREQNSVAIKQEKPSAAA